MMSRDAFSRERLRVENWAYAVWDGQVGGYRQRCVQCAFVRHKPLPT